MKLPAVSPILRISFGLVLITLSMLFSGVFLGITPDPTARNLEARKSVAETLAVQVTLQGKDIEDGKHGEIMKRLVARNDDVLSAGLRDGGGALLIDTGDHARNWNDVPLDQSTARYAQVPMYQGDKRWGTLEIRFKPLEGLLGGIVSPWLVQLVGFMSVCGFLGYWLFMRRTLRELDPSKVAPTRVRSAMNALAEGVMMVDEHAQAVLVNDALCGHLGRSEAELLGTPPSSLPWVDPARGMPPSMLPWQIALENAEKSTGSALAISPDGGPMRIFVVNASPISDANGCSRGALITFDDVTDLEKKNNELKTALTTLEKSELAVREQNRELERLATRDPMTDCLNRRAFFSKFEELFDRSRRKALPLSCLMTDIDHFKRINDSYGHGVGDEVIVVFANTLKDSVDDSALVARYGGEEFCVLFPGMSSVQAAELAEQIRHAVATTTADKTSARVKFSASFGVATLDGSMDDPTDLVNRADEALYAAKESGRNKVVSWQLGTQVAASKTETPTITNLRAFGEDDPDLAQELVLLRSQVQELERQLSRRTEALRRGEGHDHLTGLPNRILFRDRCQQAVARARRADKAVAVLCMEVATLRRVNQALGPLASDKLLRLVSERLHSSIRDTDAVTVLEESANKATLSMISDNEFGILLGDLDSNHAIAQVISRLFKSLGDGLKLNGNEIYFNASVGVAVFPNDGRTADALLKNASAARQHAHKQPGRKTYQFYSKEMNAQALKLLELEAHLRRAIHNDELTLHFQPKFCLKTGTITGVEALVRWMHPEKGMIPPSDFIPVAEQSGLISPLGHWVIRRACEWLKHWQEKGIANLHVAVNVSSLQFREASFAQRVMKNVEALGIEPRSLELELTESSVMDNLDVATAAINALSDHGFSIAIDDFGTGYSSLSYLRSFPIDCLKIDRSFLKDLTSDASADTLVATICAMGHRLGLRVVAEGVEEEEQLQILRKHRCDEVQGFLFSVPITGDEITAMALGQVEGNEALKRLGRRWIPRVLAMRA